MKEHTLSLKMSLQHWLQLSGKEEEIFDVPCKKHARFLELCLTSVVEAHNGLRPVVKLHERPGANLLHQVCICRTNASLL